jgi:WD40 repeat protein
MDATHKELLKNFKELFDEGLITEAEYEQKKNEVLGMMSRASLAARTTATTTTTPTAAPSRSPAVSSHYQATPTHLQRPTNASAQPQRPQSLTIDQILAELDDTATSSPAARPGATPAQQSSNYASTTAALAAARPSAGGMSRGTALRPSAVGAGGATEDLDYFVEMLAGTKDEKKVEQITRKAAQAVQKVQAAPAAPQADRFINCEHVLEGHQGFVFDLAVHVGSNKLFTGSADKNICVWDLATMSLVATLKGHTNAVYALTIDEATNRLFSSGWDNTVRVWHCETLKEMRCLKDHTAYVSCLTIDPVGQRLFSGDWAGTVKVWDLRTLKCLDTLSIVHTGVIYDVMVHNDTIFTASQDASIRTWSNKTYNAKDCCGEVGGGQHTDWVIAICALENRMFSASRDNSIKVWDLSQKHVKPTKTITGHEAAVTSLMIKGNYLISADGKGVVKIWHVDTYEPIDSITAHPLWIYRVKSIGDYIFTCARDKTIKIWK